MNPIDDCFLSRAEVMRRWRISIATIKRREHQGILRPIRMSTHVIRYRLSDVVRAEDEAAAGREWEGSDDQTEQDRDRQAA
jgi:predicted site-specific integrase-resolvase